MSKQIEKIILILLLICNILAISAIRWISLWIIIEVTTYLFLTYSIEQIERNNKFEFLLTYFMVRFISSCFLLIRFYIQSNNSVNIINQFVEIDNSVIQYSILTIAFLLKIGSIPFHPWVFSVIENITWKIIAILTTIQKIIPIWALAIFGNYFLITIIIILRIILIIYIPLKIKSTSYFIATSATNNIIWIIISAIVSPFAVIFYTVIYFILTISAIYNFRRNNIKIINQNFFSFSILIAIFSLIGMPPLLGFIPKLNTIICAIQIRQRIIYMLLIIVISNTFTTIIYIKPILSTMVLRIKTMELKSVPISNFTILLVHLSWPILIPILYLIN